MLIDVRSGSDNWRVLLKNCSSFAGSIEVFTLFASLQHISHVYIHYMRSMSNPSQWKIAHSLLLIESANTILPDDDRQIDWELIEASLMLAIEMPFFLFCGTIWLETLKKGKYIIYRLMLFWGNWGPHKIVGTECGSLSVEDHNCKRSKVVNLVIKNILIHSFYDFSLFFSLKIAMYRMNYDI